MRLIKLKEVMDITGLSRTKLYVLIAESNFPAQVNLGARAVAWVESEIQDWILEKIAKRDEKISA